MWQRQLQFTGGERVAQQRLDLETVLQFVSQVLVEKLQPAVATLLRAAYRRAGIAYQCGRIASVIGGTGNTDRSAHVIFAACNLWRRGEQVEDPPRKFADRRCFVAFIDDDNELVATDAPEQTILIHQSGKPVRDTAQDTIAKIVTRDIVDLAEAIEIDEQHGDARRMSGFQQLLNAFGDVGAVVQTGKRIEKRSVAEVSNGVRLFNIHAMAHRESGIFVRQAGGQIGRTGFNARNVTE